MTTICYLKLLRGKIGNTLDSFQKQSYTAEDDRNPSYQDRHIECTKRPRNSRPHRGKKKIFLHANKKADDDQPAHPKYKVTSQQKNLDIVK